MRRTLQLSVPILVCLLLTACSQPVGDSEAGKTKAELAKTQAELERDKAELAKAESAMEGEKSETQDELAKTQAELERIKAELAKAESAMGGEKSETQATLAASKKCLSNGGVATFPDGKKEPFTDMKWWSLGGNAGMVFIGASEKIHLPTVDGGHTAFSLDELASLKIGIVSNPDTPGIFTGKSSAEVEVTAIDGRTEKVIVGGFIDSSLEVTWKNKVGATNYRSLEELSGMTFTVE